ncbi:MAG TPA: tRNA lysidine(34) synthetase TilS [Caulobacteraceae bacterium]
MTTPSDLVVRELAARLARGPARPLAVAFSGGGDSLALLLATKAWADRVGRRLVAFTVDHRLQPASAAWSSWCVARASRLGVECQVLPWESPKPPLGLPAAARAARHRLIAQAARRTGAQVVLFGHTADDVVESRLMRAEGVRVSAPSIWSPSPVWPEGRGVFILRPLIEARRAAVRDWLISRGETWIDDPANTDDRHPRAGVRARISETSEALEPNSRACPSVAHLMARTRFGAAGDISVDRQSLNGAPGAQRFLAAALVCASGGDVPPRGAGVRRLIDRIAGEVDFSATLCGTRLAAGEAVRLAREVGDTRARPSLSVALAAGEVLVWDGRFEVLAHADGLTLAPLAGYAARLGKDARARLAQLHPAARSALPAVIDKNGAVGCPTLLADPRLEIRSLIPGRLAAACGTIYEETGLER